MLVRAFHSEDKKEYMNMAHAFYKSDASLSDIEDEQLHHTFQEIMKDSPYIKGRILIDQEEIVGYALLTFSWSCELDGVVVSVDELFIKEAYRSHQYGSQFFCWLEEHYTLEDYSYFLEVNPKNHRAKELYERLGFEICPYIPMLKS